MKILQATPTDIDELYALQLLAFESEAKMIGSRDVPALQETKNDHTKDFSHWVTLKLVNETGHIIGSIRYRTNQDIIEVGRLMVHPAYRRQGLAQQLLTAVDQRCRGKIKELYTCTKSWTNILLYQKVGYTPVAEHPEPSGLSFVYMRKS